MKHSKIGLELRLIRILIYVMAAIGGYVPMLLVSGFICLYEDDDTLKEDILKSFFITIVYSILKLILGYVPIITEWISILFIEVKVLTYISKYVKVFVEVIEFTRIAVLLKLAVDAYRNKE